MATRSSSTSATEPPIPCSRPCASWASIATVRSRARPACAPSARSGGARRDQAEPPDQAAPPDPMVATGSASHERGPMARERLVAVSYPVDDEFAEINTGILGADAHVAFLARLGEQERLEALRQADALIAFRLGQELPDGALAASGRLEFIQLLPAGADGVDFAAIPERLVLASNVGAYAKPIA